MTIDTVLAFLGLGAVIGFWIGVRVEAAFARRKAHGPPLPVLYIPEALPEDEDDEPYLSLRAQWPRLSAAQIDAVLERRLQEHP